MGTAKNTNPATANQAEQNNSQSNNSLKSKEDVMSKSDSKNSQPVDSNESSNTGEQSELSNEQIVDKLINAATSNPEEQKILEYEHGNISNHIDKLNSKITELEEQIRRSKLADSNGEKIRLTSLQKSKIRRDLKKVKDERANLLAEQRRIAKKLKQIYKHQEDIITRSNIKAAAFKDKYHNRFSENIYKAITEFIKSLNEDITKKYKASLTRINMEEKERLVISFCLRAPRFLVTKMTANEEWKKSYINHFITELNKIK